MIPFLLGALAIGGILLVVFWDEIVDWLKQLVSALRSMFSGLKKTIAHAVAVFIERVESGLAAIRHKLYYQEHGEWIEESSSRKIKESEIPPNIRRKIRNLETDITDEVEEELQLSLN